MRPLLWKEMRDLRPWIFMAGAGVMAVQLLCLSRSFEETFMSLHLLVLMPLLCTLTAVGLGVGQVARERHTKTLDFLLVRPVSAGTMVGKRKAIPADEVQVVPVYLTASDTVQVGAPSPSDSQAPATSWGRQCKPATSSISVPA